MIPGPPANQAPGVPSSLAVSNLAATTATLSWSTAADPDGTVAGYRYRIDGGTAVDVGNTLTVNLAGLAASTSYDFQVQSYDNLGLSSAWSAVVTETTIALGAASEFDAFVASSDGSWYDFNAETTTLPDGYVDENDIKLEFNASSAFMGLKFNNSRFRFESSVTEMGGIPALLLFSPPGSNGANFVERVAIPNNKDVDFVPAREVAVKMSYFFIDPVGGNAAKTGDTATDIRTYSLEPHVKRNGLSSYLEQTGSGTNPVPEGQGVEFVLLSTYDLDTYNNNFPFGDKGDQYGLERPEGFTTFDTAGDYGPPFSLSSPTYQNDRQIVAVGLYAHDVTDYNFQSQIYPCYPGTNIRLTVPKNELIENEFIIGLNTVTGATSNEDGYFKWYMRVPSINNGEWFLAAILTNRDFSGDIAMLLANLGIGEYHGGNGSGFYLGNGTIGNGLWFTRMGVWYRI